MRKLLGLVLILIIMFQSGCIPKNDVECTDNQKIENNICVDVIDSSVPDKATTCTKPQILEDGVCVDLVPHEDPVCGSNENLVDHLCVEKRDPICDENETLQNHVCVNNNDIPTGPVCNDDQIGIVDECINILDIENKIDYTPSEDNLEVDSAEDVLLLLQSINDKLDDLLEFSSESNKLFIEEYPIYRSDLDFDLTVDGPIDSFQIGLVNHYYYLNTILNHFDNNTFVEDTWISIIPTSDATQTMYKLYIDNGEIHYHYYDMDTYHQIRGIEGKVSNTNDVLEYTFNHIVYFADEFHWNYAIHTHYLEDVSYIEDAIYRNATEINGIYHKEIDYVAGLFYRVSFENTDELTSEKSVKGYSSETGVYYTISHENDLERRLEIDQYNDQSELVYFTTRTNSFDPAINNLDFDFNLMLIDGWDTIGEKDYIKELYNEGTLIEFDSRTTLDLNEYLGITISGNIWENETAEGFNLPSSGLTLPIDYAQYTELEALVRIEADELYNNVYNNIYSNVDDMYDDIFSTFDEYVFYKLYVDYLELTEY